MGRRPRRPRLAALEGLEGRVLLARSYPIPLGPPPGVKNVTFEHAVYTLRLEGPGVVRVRPGGRAGVGVTLLGTTEQSVLSVTPRQGPSILRALGFKTSTSNAHGSGDPLPITRLEIRTGRLGGIVAPEWADLVGPVSPLRGSVEIVDVNAIGPNARLEIGGDLGRLAASEIDLGSNGRIDVGGSLTGEIEVGALTLDGGALLVGQDLVGSTRIASLQMKSNGRLLVGRDVVGAFVVSQGANLSAGATLGVGNNVADRLEFQGPLTVGAGGRIEVRQDLNRMVAGQSLAVIAGEIRVGADLGSLEASQGLEIRDGGRLRVERDLSEAFVLGGSLVVDSARFEIGRDLAGATRIGGDVELAHGASWTIGRDALRTVEIEGDVRIADGSSLTVGRNAAGIAAGGDVDTSGAGVIRVGGSLEGLEVAGVFLGKGIPGSPDLDVGLDLRGLRVLGMQAGRGGVIAADLAVGKSLVALDVRHGLFNSLITAGVAIDGGSIGPDGPVAVYDSEIRAGVEIRDLLINGDVVSDLPRNPAGRPTRIVAGRDRAGRYTAGGRIDNLQITGSLVDAVLAASVAPEGGNGQPAEACNDVPGDGTYDAPAGTLEAGTYGSHVSVPHGSPASYDAFYRLTGYDYNTALDPVIDDCILPGGSINAGFAPAVPANPDATVPIPQPSRLTVLGGVVSTRPHVAGTDFAGIFAADTRGVAVRRIEG